MWVCLKMVYSPGLNHFFRGKHDYKPLDLWKNPMTTPNIAQILKGHALLVQKLNAFGLETLPNSITYETI